MPRPKFREDTPQRAGQIGTRSANAKVNIGL